MVDEKVTGQSDPDSISVELSTRRTGMSFQRTRMSADRTLMSVIRTSLALISFGFTIFQFFQKIRQANETTGGTVGARNFGAALILLGVLMLVGGIIYHILFMTGLRKERQMMKDAGLVHAESLFPPSLTLLTALVLLAIGLVAVMSTVFHAGPFN